MFTLFCFKYSQKKMETYIVCPYCGILQPGPHDCEWLGFNDIGDPLFCYSCGESGKEYSKSQWTRPRPRCKMCVKEGRHERHEPFFSKAFEGPQYEYDVLNETLVDAISNANLEEVKALIENGADVNYRERQFLYTLERVFVLYDKEGNLLREKEAWPLSMVVFQAGCLGFPDSLFQIAKLLCDAGADKQDALHYYEERYNARPDDAMYRLLKYDSN